MINFAPKYTTVPLLFRLSMDLSYFFRREERVNYFNIMVRKRMKAEDVDEDKEVDDDGKKVKKKKQKDFVRKI